MAKYWSWAERLVFLLLPSVFPTTLPISTTRPPTLGYGGGSPTAAHFSRTPPVLLPNGKVLVVDDICELYDSATNTWLATGNLDTARRFNIATLLPNGKVLVVGTPSELYDPVTNTWTIAGSLATARVGFTITLLPNGKVLVTGGSTATPSLPGILASTELYDPATNTWTEASSLAAARSGHAATLLPSGSVLVVGGGASAELYDPATNIWAAAGNLATDRTNFTATRLRSGKLLVSGGWVGSPPPNYVPSSELYW